MIKSIEYNGYLYDVEIIGTDEEITEAETREAVLGLEEFLSDVEVWGDKKIEELLAERNADGLTEKVMDRLHDAYYDLCFYGSMKNQEFLTRFNLTEEDLNGILI